MDRISSSLLSGTRAAGAALSRPAGGAAALRRVFASTASGAATVLNNEYQLRPVPGENGKFYLAFTRDKMEGLKDLSFIDFTKHTRIEKNDFLLSVESAKTMFDFLSPATLEIIAVNKKFAEQPSEETLKELKEQPDHDENYLMIVKLE